MILVVLIELVNRNLLRDALVCACALVCAFALVRPPVHILFFEFLGISAPFQHSIVAGVSRCNC
jgi:hypothetical protein